MPKKACNSSIQEFCIMGVSVASLHIESTDYKWDNVSYTGSQAILLVAKLVE